MLEILVQILIILHFLQESRSAIILPIFSCRFFLRSPDSLIDSILLLYILAACFCKDDMLTLHQWISYSSFSASHLRMDSFSKHCTNWCAISRIILIRGESTDIANPLSFSFRVHRPVFVLGPCTLK